MAYLRGEILALSARLGLDRDIGIGPEDDPDDALGKLDNHLCELKELQIRDGLHVFGQAPTGDQLHDLLVALVRVPRGSGEGGDASLLRALGSDLGLAGFDPLDCPMAEPWAGPRPSVLRDVSDQTWRSHGDTVERLELLARELVDGRRRPDPEWAATRAVLAQLDGSPPSGAGKQRSGGDPGGAAGAGWPLRRAGTERRADPRPPRRAADRAQLLLGRQPRRADRRRPGISAGNRRRC